MDQTAPHFTVVSTHDIRFYQSQIAGLLHALQYRGIDTVTLQQSYSEVNRLKNEVRHLTNASSFVEELKESFRAHLHDLTMIADEFEEQAAETSRKLTERNEDFSRLNEIVDSMEDIFATKEAELETTLAKKSEIEELLNKSRQHALDLSKKCQQQQQKVLTLQGEVQSMRKASATPCVEVPPPNEKELQRLKDQVAGLLKQNQRLVLEKNELSIKNNELETQLIDAAMTRSEMDREKLKKIMDPIEKELQRLKTKEEATKAAYESLNKEVERLTACNKVLRKAKENCEAELSKTRKELESAKSNSVRLESVIESLTPLATELIHPGTADFSRAQTMLTEHNQTNKEREASAATTRRRALTRAATRSTELSKHSPLHDFVYKS